MFLPISYIPNDRHFYKDFLEQRVYLNYFSLHDEKALRKQMLKHTERTLISLFHFFFFVTKLVFFIFFLFDN